jgi:hypothetical protein
MSLDKEKKSNIYMEQITLPIPPEGYEYILRKKVFIRNKDPSQLTSKQRSDLKYREKNRERILEQKREKYRKQKQINLSKEETSETTKSE